MNLKQAQKIEKEDEVAYMEYAKRKKLENMCRVCLHRLECKTICELKAQIIKEGKR